ncbi:hypothetical protein [Pelagibaculum spongiae]|uniref:Uncharacterized protein n=1 Tax=Pelagibaculum spongiae TaxID=2080658 RepID=A0A2V1GWP4_9GAMM|nr:hypothetical protein [Pelagibaculum spongiae]PVZ65616.1 hypothetical protein DC094_17165 [Pelagibaculum spongiae]
MSILIILLVNLLIGGAALWLASKVLSVQLSFKETLITVAITALVAVIPLIGWIASLIVLFYLLQKYSGNDVWPDLILLVIISRIITFAAYSVL